MTKTGLGMVGLLALLLFGTGLGLWLWPTPLPQAPDFFAIEGSEFRLWARGDQVEVLSSLQGDLLKAREAEMDLWIESPRELGPLVFQVSGRLSRAEVRSGGESRGFEPPPSDGKARFFLEWQPEKARQDPDRTGFFYPLVFSFSGPSVSQPEETVTIALIGSRAFLDRDLYGVDWLGCGLPNAVVAGGEFLALAHARNISTEIWPDQGHARVRLAARWHGVGGEAIGEAGPRVELEAPVEPGDELTRWLTVQAPETAGRYVLEFDLFFEPLTWFSEREASTCEAEIEVR